jgi:hypothetical protein
LLEKKEEEIEGDNSDIKVVFLNQSGRVMIGVTPTRSSQYHSNTSRPTN